MEGIKRGICALLCVGVALPVAAEDAFPFIHKKTAFGSSVSGYALTRDTEILTPHGIVKDIDFLPEKQPVTPPTAGLASTPAPAAVTVATAPAAPLSPVALPQVAEATPPPAMQAQQTLSTLLSRIEPAAGPSHPNTLQPAQQTASLAGREPPPEMSITFFPGGGATVPPPGSIPFNPVTQGRLFIGPAH